MNIKYMDVDEAKTRKRVAEYDVYEKFDLWGYSLGALCFGSLTFALTYPGFGVAGYLRMDAQGEPHAVSWVQ